MARPTTTRTDLRRMIARQLGMPFSKRNSSGYSTLTGALASYVTDTKLRQARANYWAGQWLYMVALDEARMIVQSTTLGQLVLESPLSSAPSVGDSYEIHSVFGAYEIHDAINRAIVASYPSFYDTTEDTSLIVCEDKMSYDLSSISPTIGIVHEVAIERPVTRMWGTVTSTSYDGVNDLLTIYLEDTVDLSDVDSDWWISIYDGAGRGVAYQCTGLVNNTLKCVMVTATSDPGLDTTSDYLLWNAEDQQLDWYRTKEVHFDAKENPSTLRLYSPIYAYRGSRIRIKYSTAPSSLTAETSTTVVPSGYVIPMAISLLALSRVGDNRIDRQRYAALQELYAKEAELFKMRNFFRYPDIELWMEGDDIPDEYISDEKGDPLSWR